MRFAAFLCVAVAIAIPEAAQSDPFADFRIPDHTIRSGRLFVSASGDWQSSSGPQQEAWDANQAGRIATEASLFRDSETLAYSYSGRVQMDGSRYVRKDHTRDFGADDRSDERNERSNEGIGVGGLVRAFPWNTPIGVELQANSFAGYEFMERGTNSRTITLASPGTRTDQRSQYERDGHNRGATLSLSAGYGRVRDATPVWDAIVLEERLLATGTLVRPLSSKAMRELAALFALRNDYASAHDRPERFFWRDVERMLRDDGALTGSLDAFGQLRALELVEPRLDVIPGGYGFRRMRGWFAGGVIEGRHQRWRTEEDDFSIQEIFVADTLVSSQPTSTHRRSIYASDDVRAGGRVEFHAPFGSRWQVDARSQVVAPIRPDEEGFSASSFAQVMWFVADRWRWSLDVSHSRSIFEPRHSDVRYASWRAGGETGLAFFLEDRAQLFAAVTHQQSSSKLRETRLNLGLTYRFFGALDAPGLIDPQRPLD